MDFARTVRIESLADKRSYTESVVEEIFEKDIRRRVKIRNKESFEAVREYIINNFGSTTSINNLWKDLRKNGQIVSRQTSTRYIKALVDAKILYECDFILRSAAMNYSYIQVAYTIALIKDNYPKYVMTTDFLLQQRGGIQHVKLMDFMNTEKLLKQVSRYIGINVPYRNRFTPGDRNFELRI